MYCAPRFHLVLDLLVQPARDPAPTKGKIQVGGIAEESLPAALRLGSRRLFGTLPGVRTRE
jgi:hypothetical protein